MTLRQVEERLSYCNYENIEVCNGYATASKSIDDEILSITLEEGDYPRIFLTVDVIDIQINNIPEDAQNNDQSFKEFMDGVEEQLFDRYELYYARKHKVGKYAVTEDDKEIDKSALEKENNVYKENIDTKIKRLIEAGLSDTQIVARLSKSKLKEDEYYPAKKKGPDFPQIAGWIKEYFGCEGTEEDSGYLKMGDNRTEGWAYYIEYKGDSIHIHAVSGTFTTEETYPIEDFYGSIPTRQIISNIEDTLEASYDE